MIKDKSLKLVNELKIIEKINGSVRWDFKRNWIK